jgi:hypothetical protein
MKRAGQYVAAIAVLLFQLVPCLAQRNGVAEIDQLVTTEIARAKSPAWPSCCAIEKLNV